MRVEKRGKEKRCRLCEEGGLFILHSILVFMRQITVNSTSVYFHTDNDTQHGLRVIGNGLKPYYHFWRGCDKQPPDLMCRDV